MTTAELYAEAERSDVPVMAMPLPKTRSISLCTDRRCYIAIDETAMQTEAELRVHLGHELGHCETGAFYSRYAACDVPQKHENTADKWAIEHLITADALDDAVAAGNTEMWQLAEYFDVTEEFMRKAVCWYVHGNLSTELYFRK